MPPLMLLPPGAVHVGLSNSIPADISRRVVRATLGDSLASDFTVWEMWRDLVRPARDACRLLPRAAHKFAHMSMMTCPPPGSAFRIGEGDAARDAVPCGFHACLFCWARKAASAYPPMAVVRNPLVITTYRDNVMPGQIARRIGCVVGLAIYRPPVVGRGWQTVLAYDAASAHVPGARVRHLSKALFRDELVKFAAWPRSWATPEGVQSLVRAVGAGGPSAHRRLILGVGQTPVAEWSADV